MRKGLKLNAIIPFYVSRTRTMALTKKNALQSDVEKARNSGQIRGSILVKGLT